MKEEKEFHICDQSCEIICKLYDDVKNLED